MKNAIWRSRAAAILGFVIMMLVVFPGLPGTLKSTVLTVLGLLVMSIGLAGSRHKAYEEEAKKVSAVAQLEGESAAKVSGAVKEENFSPLVSHRDNG